jgi:hypothetical protein
VSRVGPFGEGLLWLNATAVVGKVFLGLHHQPQQASRPNMRHESVPATHTSIPCKQSYVVQSLMQSTLVGVPVLQAAV